MASLLVGLYFTLWVTFLSLYCLWNKWEETGLNPPGTCFYLFLALLRKTANLEKEKGQELAELHFVSDYIHGLLFFSSSAPSCLDAL